MNDDIKVLRQKLDSNISRRSCCGIQDLRPAVLRHTLLGFDQSPLGD